MKNSLNQVAVLLTAPIFPHNSIDFNERPY